LGYTLIHIPGAAVAGIRHATKGANILMVVGSTSASVTAGPEGKTRALAHGVIAALRR
jgi:hypothetical protein